MQLKDQFIKKKMKEKDCETKDEDKKITPEELSEFYKKFLDENYTLHKNYNKYVFFFIAMPLFSFSYLI